MEKDISRRNGMLCFLYVTTKLNSHPFHTISKYLKRQSIYSPHKICLKISTRAKVVNLAYGRPTGQGSKTY